MRRIETHDWWPELVALKDELSLRELGERFGVTPGAVSAALKRQGLSRRSAPPGPRSARTAGLEARPGSKDGLILPFADALGQVPDAEIARQAGVSVRTVASFRARNGIAGYSGPRVTGKRGRRSRIEPFHEMVGRVPDRVVAERAGVSLNAVRNYRVKHDIAAAGHQPLRRDEGAAAWQVRIASDDADEVIEGVVLAEDVMDATRKARARHPGTVLEVRFVGDLL